MLVEGECQVWRGGGAGSCWVVPGTGNPGLDLWRNGTLTLNPSQEGRGLPPRPRLDDPGRQARTELLRCEIPYFLQGAPPLAFPSVTPLSRTQGNLFHACQVQRWPSPVIPELWEAVVGGSLEASLANMAKPYLY